YHLVEALTGYAGRPASPEVTVTEVLEYVGRKVPATARLQHNEQQEPMFRFTGVAFPIALVLGGKGIQRGMELPDPLRPLPRVHGTLEAEHVEGSATVVDVEDAAAGHIDGKAVIKDLRKDGKVTVVRIKKVGG